LDQEITYLDRIKINKKRVFIRVDFNVPLDEFGNITDDIRIRSVLQTINYCMDAHAIVILGSHMGRPKGKFDKKLSLLPVAKRLSRLLEKDVIFLNDCIGPEVEETVKNAKPEDVILLENLRFNPGEEKNDEEFAKKLASLCDVYVNDAFAVSHRAHASVSAITKFVPVSAAGFLMRKELNYFKRAMQHPQRPLAAIIGGAKVSSKLEALHNLIDKVDKLLIGGGMAFTFLKSWGYEVGKSLVEKDMLNTALDIIKLAKEKKIKFYLPVDCVAADKFSHDSDSKVVTVQEIPPESYCMDIGPATISLFSEALSDAKTIIWNGPMGVFEYESFAKGTYSIAQVLARSRALTIVGGGDTDVAVHNVGETYQISYISTGGGAFLELLAGKELPALKALKEAHNRNNKK
jgi:phosphoglycerate kinase